MNITIVTVVGALVVGDERLELEVDAFQQLALLAGFGCGIKYLRELCHASLRATNVNGQLQSRSNRSLVLRTRLGPTLQRQVYAIVTKAYVAVDTHVVLRTVAPQLDDARTELRYDGTGVRATALWMPDAIVDLAAGDVFKVGVSLETDDTGRGRIRIAGVVFRNRCLNLIIIDEAEVETVSAVHKGGPAVITDQVRQGVELARAKIGSFLEAFGHARTVHVEPTALLKAWVADRVLLPRLARDRDQVTTALLSAWQKEPGDSLADCVNAVTRAAHETTSFGQELREELERQASRLVYARVR